VYTLASGASGKCIDVVGASVDNSALLVQVACDPAATHMQWKAVAQATGLCISDKDGSTAGNNPIVEETCSDVARMQWSFNYVSGATSGPTTPPGTGRQAEKLNRGLVSVRSGGGNYVSWRLLGTDPAAVAFNLYRAGTKVNAS